MGKRTWLNNQLVDEYFPAIAALPDTAEGHTAAADLAAKLRQSWYDRGSVHPGEKELGQLQALFDITRNQLKAKFGSDHFCLKYFGMTTAEYTQLNNQKQQNTADRNEDVKQLDQPDAIVAKAVELLEQSPHWFDIAAALAVLTGRRSSEILATAQFEKASQWSVTFTGALKRRGERQILSFEIPTLTTADRVIAALATLRRELPEVVNLAPEEINRKYGDRVAQACEQHFNGLVPPRAGSDLYTHLFRAVYACIATFWYCPAWVEATEYKAAIQGHYAVLDETDPTLRRSLGASRHYSDYEIADAVIAQAGGKRKGIKLGWGGIQSIEIFQRHQQNDAALEQPELTLPSTHSIEAMSKPSSSIQPRTKKTPRKSLWINYQDEDLAQQVLSRFGSTETTEETIAAMSKWLRWSIEKLEDSQPEDDSEEPSPDTKREPKVEPKTTPTDQREASELDELKEMFGKTLEAVQSLTMQLAASHRGKDATASKRMVAAIQANPDLEVEVIAPISHEIDHEATPKKRSKRSSSPESQAEVDALTQQLLNAIEDIQRYNQHIDSLGLPHKLKREITVNFLKAITPNQQLINRILQEHQAIIEQHHQQMQIQPKHNSTYRERITLADVQRTVKGQN